MGIIRCSPEFLGKVLQLPEEVRIERVFSTPDEKLGVEGNLCYLVLSGESLPGEPPREGQPIPMMYAKIDQTGSAVTWNFQQPI